MLLGFWTAWSRGISSLLPAALGLLWASVWSSDLVGMQRWSVPRPVVLCGKALLPMIGSYPPGLYIEQHHRQQQQQQARGQELAQQLQALLAQHGHGGRRQAGQGAGVGAPGAGAPGNEGGFGMPRVEPDPAAVARLVEMGFPQDTVERALVETQNNEDAAVARLVG